MSNVNMNNTGVNCENTVNGNACNLENAQVYRNSNTNSKYNNVEFGTEFNPNGQVGNQNQSAPFSSNEFEPNRQQKPVSERTAWN